MAKKKSEPKKVVVKTVTIKPIDHTLTKNAFPKNYSPIVPPVKLQKQADNAILGKTPKSKRKSNLYK